MNHEQLRARYNKMFPDRKLEEQQKELGLMQTRIIDGTSGPEVLEKITFSIVLSICDDLKERGKPIPEDLTDALLEIRRQVKGTFAKRSKPTRVDIKYGKELFPGAFDSDETDEDK